MGEGTRDPLGTLGKLRGYSGDFRTTGSCTLLFLYGYLKRMQWKALELGIFGTLGIPGEPFARLDCEAQLAKDQRSLVPCESE